MAALDLVPCFVECIPGCFFFQVAVHFWNVIELEDLGVSSPEEGEHPYVETSAPETRGLFGRDVLIPGTEESCLPGRLENDEGCGTDENGSPHGSGDREVVGCNDPKGAKSGGIEKSGEGEVEDEHVRGPE